MKRPAPGAPCIMASSVSRGPRLTCPGRVHRRMHRADAGPCKMARLPMQSHSTTPTSEAALVRTEVRLPRSECRHRSRPVGQHPDGESTRPRASVRCWITPEAVTPRPPASATEPRSRSLGARGRSPRRAAASLPRPAWPRQRQSGHAPAHLETRPDGSGRTSTAGSSPSPNAPPLSRSGGPPFIKT